MTRFFSNPGFPNKIRYKMIYCPRSGVKMLEACGLDDFYGFIQSHRDSTDLNYLLKGMDPNQVLGGLSTYSFDDLLESPVIDVTSLPKNAGEMLNLVQTANNLFDGLPDVVRGAFNYSSQKFISSFGSEEFANIINKLNSDLNDAPSPVYDISKRGKVSRHVDNTENVVNTDNTGGVVNES